MSNDVQGNEHHYYLLLYENNVHTKHWQAVYFHLWRSASTICSFKIS